jgi:hypothetical protein
MTLRMLTVTWACFLNMTQSNQGVSGGLETRLSLVR